uniref:Uncharacterized protein n=1 Tax=Lepeophtheirus salmonis TaxID=72036 RepID=A0A0K2V491_LEPSM
MKIYENEIDHHCDYHQSIFESLITL